MNNIISASIVETQISNITASLDGQEHFLENNASYEIGLLGVSLYYCYYARYTGDDSYYNKAEDAMVKGLAALNLASFKRIYASDSLDNHLAHIGRFLEFSNFHKFLDLDIQEYLQEMDGTLADLMKSKISIADFDLNSGALAAGYYFLSRLPHNPSVKDHLAVLVHGIQDQAQKDEDGDYCWASPSLFQRIYLGLSHGSSLLISFLVNVYEQNVEQETCKEILSKAIKFLLKQKWKTEFKGLFPNYIGDSERPKQFSLCYGDLGIGYALFRAATIMNDESLTIVANEILDDTLLRKKEDNLTLDASIIYGAAGVATAYEKLYRLTDDTRFMEAATYWYKQIPAYAIHENEFAGYKSRLPDVGPIWNLSFGWGIIGIGISLMKYAKPELPPLDALMMNA